ncbi:MAG: response regulator [Magnetococcales bacterium]|nr:response regulator [Magnetococcales bacterium]NGZ27924.1 response regulator [Magnetococcales bacterium]
MKPFSLSLVFLNHPLKVNTIFGLLSSAVVVLLLCFWFFSLEPGLQKQARVHANALAQSHAQVLEMTLLAKDKLDPEQLNQQLTKIFLLIDPNTSERTFEGISLEFDYSALSSPVNLNGQWGKVPCSHCIVTTVPLYEPRHQELVGYITFFGSTAFLERLKQDALAKLILEAATMLIALLMVWLWITNLLKNQESLQQDLQQAKELAEQSNQSKSEFLANMSHEIRTPMNGVVGMLQLLHNTPLSPVQQHYMQMALHSAELQLALINDILDFSRIEKGKLILEMMDYPLENLIEETMTLLAEQAIAKGLSFSCFLSPRLPKQTRIDPTRIKQILFNLLGNAIKFTQQGEVVLLVSHRPHARQDEQVSLLFEVRDTGIGILPEVADSLFQPFTQADASITRKFGGSGLGLNISRQLAQLMGGEITLQSLPQLGSSFVVDIPIPLFVTPDARKIPPVLKQATFMVVSSLFHLTGIVERYLGEGQVPSPHILTPEMAVRHYRTLRDNAASLHLILVDGQHNLPGALDLIKRLRQETLAVPLKIILLHFPPEVDSPTKSLWEVDYCIISPLRCAEFYHALQGVVEPRDEVSTLPEPPAPVPPPRFSGTVLLVEDNAINQVVATAMLEEMGVVVHSVNHGEEALAWLANHRCDLVFMDVQMPVMDGLTATRHWRAQEQQDNLTRLPVVAMTAHVLPSDYHNCMEAGMDDYLAKPIRMEKIAAVLAKWLASG